MLLILDIDETLLYADKEGLERLADFYVGNYRIYLRPHLQTFLDYAFENFDVAVWTSSSASYATKIVNRLLSPGQMLEFLWCRGRCTRRFDEEEQTHYWLKNFKKLKKRYRLEQVLVVDDTPQKHERNYGNLVRISEFTGNEDDDALLRLIPYLEQLKEVENVRAIEKRGWLRRTTPIANLD